MSFVVIEWNDSGFSPINTKITKLIETDGIAVGKEVKKQQGKELWVGKVESMWCKYIIQTFFAKV